jgi:PAS domain S-box-containing protein
MIVDNMERNLAEEKFRLAVEACPNGMVMIDGDGKMVMVNTEIEQQFGYRREELIGQPIEILVPVRMRGQHARHREAFDRRPETRRIGVGPDLYGLRKDGSEFAVEIGLTPISTVEGLLVLGVVVDVSDRKDAALHLAQMESKYRGLLEAAPDAMVVVNQRGEIALLNLQAEKQFGYWRDELLGQQVTNIIPEGFSERLLADSLRSSEDALTQQIGTGIELHGRRKDGGEFPIEIMLSPLESAEGTLVTAAIRDISVRKRMDRLKDEFVATVSHELRTPLTSISASLGLLAGLWAGKLPEAAARLLKIADKNSHRLVRLINDILDIEKLEAGRVVFNLSCVDVRTLINQTIEANRSFAEDYGVRIRLATAPVDSEVSADSDRLAQVITNLLSNAIKFSPADEEVLVAIENNRGIVRISVRDHGCGVPADFKPHIFEKFAQADATSSRQKGGTGLGLSIVKQIVERLHGAVSFDDAPGGGTIFCIDLPAWDASAGWDIDLETDSSAPRILLCEDDRPTATAIRERLSQAGFAVDFAYLAVAALARARAISYAAIIVDLQLPDGDHSGLILGLQSLVQYRKMTIVVISGNPEPARGDVVPSELNILKWLSKPLDLNHLVRTLTASLAREPHDRPRVLHIDDDPSVLAAVSQALHSTADVISVDTVESARHALLTYRIDLAVLDILLGTHSGLELLPYFQDNMGNTIPIIIFSAKSAGLEFDKQIHDVLAKSDTSIESLVATVHDRLAHRPSFAFKEDA